MYTDLLIYYKITIKKKKKTNIFDSIKFSSNNLCTMFELFPMGLIQKVIEIKSKTISVIVHDEMNV